MFYVVYVDLNIVLRLAMPRTKERAIRSVLDLNGLFRDYEVASDSPLLSSVTDGLLQEPGNS